MIASMVEGDGYVMNGYVNGNNNCRQTAASASNNIITFSEGMGVFTLRVEFTAWTFHDGTYYLDATSTTSNNYLKGSTDVDKYNKFSISFSGNEAVITCTGKDSKNILRYNAYSKLFSCYNSGQEPVYLFKETNQEVATVTDLTISGTPTTTEYYVGDTPNADGLIVTATYSDKSTSTVTPSWTFSPETIAEGTTQITATATFGGKEASKTIEITIKTIANTAETAYTVAQAYELIDAGKDLNTEVYVKGLISQVDSYNEEFNSISYWISEDGTTEGQQFQCYSGKGLEGADFSSIDDLQMGCEVVVKGILNKYYDNYQFNYDNEIVSIDKSNARTLSSIEISGTPTKTTYSIGETPSADGLTVTAIYSDESTSEVTPTWTFSPETIEE